MPTTVSCAKSAAALAAAGIVLLNAWEIAARTIDGRFERTLAVGGDTLVLDVQTVSGRIEVTAGEPGQARVTGRIRGYADRWTPDGAEVVEDRVRTIEADPPIVLADDVLRVGHLEPPLSRQVGMSYEIVVPANTRVRARTGSGALLVERVAGPVDVGSGSGGTRVSDVAGNVTIESTSGSIEVMAVDGDVALRTGSGAILVKSVDAALRARTGSGRVRVEGRPGGAWDLSAGSGDIRIDLPRDVAFEIDAQTWSGTVRSDHPVTVRGKMRRGRLQGDVRGGGPRVTLRTGSGDVTID